MDKSKKSGTGNNEILDLIWSDFERTGQISYYLLYKKLTEK